MNTQTIKRADLPTIGAPLAEGHFAGILAYHDGTQHALIDMGRTHELVNVCRGVNTECYDTVSSEAVTQAMLNAASDIARQANEKGMLIPARDALELLYRHFKPTTRENSCTFRDGDNPGSVPAGFPYRPDLPLQTMVEGYRQGEPNAFEPDWYLSGTQYSALTAYAQLFANGNTTGWGKDGKARVRLVRTLIIVE